MLISKGPARVAGALYAILGIFSAAVLCVVAEGKTVGEFLEAVNLSAESRALFAVLAGLTIASILVAAWLLIRARVTALVLLICAAMLPAALAWNVTAIAFWLLPAPFLWASFTARRKERAAKWS